MDLKMKCTEAELMNMLVECYTYYFKRVADGERNLAEDDVPGYALAKDEGNLEALGAIMLQVFGGKKYYEIWEKTMEWANQEESDDRNNAD